MRRWVVMTMAGLGVLTVVLAIALASIGTNLDRARIERDDLQFEANDLQQEVDTLTAERDRFKSQVDEHAKTIEQLKTGQARSNESSAAATATATATTPVSSGAETAPASSTAQ